MAAGRCDDVLVRQLWPSDADLIRPAFDQLSLETRYLRYGLPVSDPAVVLSWIPGLDGIRNAALGAIHPATGALLGSARYATAPAGAHVEVAVVVVDAWQGRGLGPRLLAELCRHAQEVGVAPLRAYVLASNRRALRLLWSFGGWQVLSRRDGFIEYEYLSPSRERGRPPP